MPICFPLNFDPAVLTPALLSPVLVLLLSALASHLLLLVLIPQFRSYLLDQPNARSSHRHPIPRGGGLSFVLVCVVANAFALFIGVATRNAPVSVSLSVLPLLALPLAVVGFLDDCHNLSSMHRFSVHLVTAFFLILVSPLQHPFFALPLILISITAVINFTNFMDGLDGLVAGCMVVAISTLAISLSAPWPIWALVGALSSFLLWNWSPAKVFMGDVGSTFLGSVFAGLVLQATSWTLAFAYILVATPLLADSCVCVFRRWFAGQPVFLAHRLHLFQRLHQAGWSHSRVSIVYITATAVLAVAMLAGSLSWVCGLAVFELLVGVWLDQRFAVPFTVASRS